MISTLDVFVRACCLTVLLSAAACWRPTNVDRARVLELHHRTREDVIPTAGNMRLLRYSKYLESVAYYWTGANNSKLPDQKNYTHSREIGINLAFSTGRKPSLAESICPWIKEAQYYIYANNTCRHTCDEYKQMISSHASEVGCAIGKRNDAVPGWPNPQYVTVCAYRPRGNFATKRPYRSAPSCYYCRMDEYCYRNQCVKNPQFNHVYPINNLPKPEDREVPKCAVV